MRLGLSLGKEERQAMILETARVNRDEQRGSKLVRSVRGNQGLAGGMRGTITASLLVER